MRPIAGQLLHLQLDGSPAAAAYPLERTLLRGVLAGWHRAFVGATEEDAGFDERTTLAAVLNMIDAVCELLPQAWTASLMAAKVGLRPGTADQVWWIGWSSAVPNLMYATGHYRNGILLAPLTAELVANAVLDGHIDPMLELSTAATIRRTLMGNDRHPEGGVMSTLSREEIDRRLQTL